MLDLGYAKSGTDEAFAEPQVGDRFHEMYSFWMYVVHMDGEYVVAMEASPPCTVPDDGRLRRFASHDAFRAAYAYGTIPGYWVQLADRGNDVSGWYEQLLPDLPPEAETVAPVAAPAHAQGLLDVVDGQIGRAHV